ncbi:MAG: hypothetical protein J3R72DRAFT_423213 [Linnemannia gamsii]|nr:MAG: hypothetical protein J3R72DRAFT_423213 [Linnemannia gamsii]
MNKDLKAFFTSVKDLEKANHFQFFDHVTGLHQGSAESTWLAGIQALANSDRLKFVNAANVLRRKYDKSKKDGLLASYWRKRKAESDLVGEADDAANETAKRLIRSSRLKAQHAFNAVDKGTEVYNPFLEASNDAESATSITESDTEYVPSESSASSSPEKKQDNYGIDRLCGPGQHTSLLKETGHWIVNKKNVSTSLMEFCNQSIQDNETLNDPTAILSLNHIFHFDCTDSESALYRYLDDDDLWKQLSSTNALHDFLDPSIIARNHRIAYELSTAMEERRRSIYLQWISDGVKDDLEQIYQGLLATSALWNEQQINEDSFVKTRTSEFPPSRQRKVVDLAGQGRRSDYHIALRVHGTTIYPLVVEAKAPFKKSTTVRTDFEKLANEMKDAIDSIMSCSLSVKNFDVYRLLIEGYKMTIYSMNHKWDGVYCLHSIAVAYVPRDHSDLFGVANVLNILLNIKTMITRPLPLLKELAQTDRGKE